MANTDAAYGFKPYGNVLRAQMYAVVTAPTIYIHINDLVCADNDSYSTPVFGYIQGIYDAANLNTTTGDAYPVIGSVLALFDSNFDPVKYFAPGTVGNGTIAGYALVADHPDQLYEAQEDGDTAAIASGDVGLNFEVYSGTLTLGNTTTGISKQEIDSNSHATTNTIPVRVHRMAHPDEDTIGSTGCRWVVSINDECQLYGQGTAIS